MSEGVVGGHTVEGLIPSYPPTSLILSITVVILVALTVLAWRFRAQAGAKLFGALQLTNALWVTFAIVALNLSPGATQLRMWGISTGLSLIAVILWFAFILSYTGRTALLRGRRFGVISLPLAAGAGLYFVFPSWTPLVGQLEQTTGSVGTTVQVTLGPVGGLTGAYIYLVFLAGLAVVVKTIFQNNSLFVGQGIAVILGSLVSIVGSMLSIVGVPEAGYPTTEVVLSGQAGLWGYAVFGQQLLKIAPAVTAVGERAIFEDLEYGILVVGNDGIITRTNPASRAYLNAAGLSGRHVDSVLDKMGVTTLEALPTQFQSRGQTYRVTRSQITDWRDDAIGDAVVIRDITPLVKRKQRLQVLNRILRHNVRNDMTVLLGRNAQLRNGSSCDPVTVSETVDKKARGLLAISEKIIEFDKALDSKNTVGSVKLERILTDISSALRNQYPAATIRSEISVDEITTSPKLLSLVLDEVITNAVEHAGDAPEVVVEAERRTHHVEIAVADDGPGIPQGEIEPITEGEETDLQHTSSFGLWMIHWGMKELGGTWSSRRPIMARWSPSACLRRRMSASTVSAGSYWVKHIRAPWRPAL